MTSAVSRRPKYVVMAGWDDVPHLSAVAKAEMLMEYLPHQRDARSRGIPSLGSGAIYPVAEDEIRVKMFDLPAHWPRGFALDTGWNWTCALWGAHDLSTDTLYVYSAYKRSQAEPPIHADAIKARGADIPGVGDAAAISNTDGRQFLEIYRKLGLDLQLADKSVETGLQEVWVRLSTGKLKILDNCGGVFEEMRMYRRDEKGKIVKVDDHYMDCLRYLVRALRLIFKVVKPRIVNTDPDWLQNTRPKSHRGTGWMA